MSGYERYDVDGLEHVWLSKRVGSGRWYRTWFDRSAGQTRRASLGTKDLRDAIGRLWAWNLENGDLANIPASEISLAEVLTRYYQRHASHQRSRDTARLVLRKWTDYFPAITVFELTTDRQNCFVKYLRAQGYADGYIQKILSVGKAALNLAKTNSEITALPPLISVTGDGERDRILSLDEVSALFNTVQHNHVLMYLMVAFNTLARPEAILELRSFSDRPHQPPDSA